MAIVVCFVCFPGLLVFAWRGPVVVRMCMFAGAGCLFCCLWFLKCCGFWVVLSACVVGARVVVLFVFGVVVSCVLSCL